MQRSLIGMLIVGLSGCFHTQELQRQPAASTTPSSVVTGFEKDYSLKNNADVVSLSARFEEMRKKLKANDRPLSDEGRRWPIYFMQNEEIGDKKLKKVLSFMSDTLKSIAKNPSDASILQFQEMHHSLLLNFKPPVQDHYTVKEAIGLGARDLFQHPFLKGKKPAQNVGNGLWEQDGDISQKSLTLGFHRSSLPLAKSEVCDYHEPKTGYGTRPGFTVKCGVRKIKVKFKEVHSEPFTTRIFWALGYHVEPVDYVSSMRIRYDRKIIEEFNARKKINLKVTFFGKTLVEKPYGKPFNAIDYWDHLLLKDGSIIAHSRIQEFIFDSEGRFRQDQEQKIAEVITDEAQIQESDDRLVKVGPWSFNELDHADRREMRALVMLAAWVNWYDVRFDNNRLVLEDDAQGNPQMKFYLGDVGSSMGIMAKLIHFKKNQIERSDLFSDRFTASPGGKFKIKNYFRVLDQNSAFEEATIEDARWIAGLMLQLKPEQIHEALVASGFSPEDVTAFETKLLKRLEFMKEDLDL